jgi:membrane protein implicated in regulation of membrane protease activity
MHVLLVLPLLGLLIFFVGLPLSISIPVYIVILIISAGVYWITYRTMRQKPKSGKEQFIGWEARVVSINDPGAESRYIIKIRGEIWMANSKDELQPGTLVKITGFDGLIAEIVKS